MQGKNSDQTKAQNVDHEAAFQAVRETHPTLSVSTELIRFDDNFAVVRVEISLTGGMSVSSLGMAPANADAPVEMAEDRALRRALVLLGFSDSEANLVSVTVPVAEKAQDALTDAVQFGGNRAAEVAAAPGATQAVEAEVAPEIVADDPPLEDYSWTSFWQWARGLGYQNKIAVEEVIGQSITPLNPAQVRNLLRAKTGAA